MLLGAVEVANPECTKSWRHMGQGSVVAYKAWLFEVTFQNKAEKP